MNPVVISPFMNSSLFSILSKKDLFVVTPLTLNSRSARLSLAAASFLLRAFAVILTSKLIIGRVRPRMSKQTPQASTNLS